MITRIFALDYESMQEHVRTRPDSLVSDYFVSILGQNTPAIFASNAPNAISLIFDDVVPQYLEPGHSCMVFSAEQADRIIAFLEKYHSALEEHVLYTHCAAGISRSGAVATFANRIFQLDTVRFQEDNPQIRPNPYVLGLLLDRWHRNFV